MTRTGCSPQYALLLPARRQSRPALTLHQRSGRRPWALPIRKQRSPTSQPVQQHVLSAPRLLVVCSPVENEMDTAFSSLPPSPSIQRVKQCHQKP